MNNTKPARDPYNQCLAYIGKTINFDTPGVSSGVLIGTIPSGAEIVYAMVKTKTAFNATTTNVLTVGQNSTSYNDIATAADVDEAAAEAVLILRGSDLSFTADTGVYAKYTQSGTAATAGAARILVFYVNSNNY
jgi:hypothetical protein